LFTVFIPVKSTAARKLKNCTGECGNKFTTIESYSYIANTACYGKDRLKQYFRQKGSVIVSQPNRFKNFMHINDIESGELCRNTNVMKLKNCTGEYENKFTRKQYNLLGGRYLVTLFARI
jgi:hypothetical protein